jgi:hypothetical protein
MSLHGVDKMRQEDMIPIALFSHSIPVSCCLGRGDGGGCWGLGWEIVTEGASRRAHRLIRLYPYIYAETSKPIPIPFCCVARRGLFAGSLPRGPSAAFARIRRENSIPQDILNALFGSSLGREILR